MTRRSGTRYGLPGNAHDLVVFSVGFVYNTAMPLNLFISRACIRLALLVAGTLLVWAAGLPAIAVQLNEDRLLQVARAQYGENGVKAVTSWLRMIEATRPLATSEQLRAVNRFWNSSVRSVEDINVWRQTDYWATPLESLGKRAGDCEDYVIGKYFTLLQLGVSPEKLRLIYVRAKVGGQSIAHMVLGYYETPSSTPLVLDSLTSSILPASQRKDLTPVFSFNAQGIYVAGQQRSVESISRWQDLLTRMRTEGIELNSSGTQP